MASKSTKPQEKEFVSLFAILEWKEEGGREQQTIFSLKLMSLNTSVEAGYRHYENIKWELI